MISVTLQPDGTGYVYIPGRGRDIDAGSVGIARDRAARILSEHAASTGELLEVSVLDIGETVTLTVHPDGRIIIDRAVSNGLHADENARPVAPPVVVEVAPTAAVEAPEPAAAVSVTKPAYAPRPHTPLTSAPVVAEDDEIEHTVIRRRTRRRGARGAVLGLPGGASVTVRQSALVGRQPTAPDDDHAVQLVPIEDTTRSVSKTHCLLVWEGDIFTVSDLGSTNGTDIDRDGTLIPVTTDTLVPVRDGDTILIGDNSFTVSLPEQPDNNGE